MKKVGQKIDVVSLRFMSVRWIFAILLLLFPARQVVSQSYQNSYSMSPQAPSPGDNLTLTLRQLKNGLTDLKHEMRNHESEIRLFDNRLKSQESTFEHFKQQLAEDVQAQRDFVRASNVNIEGKTETLNQSLKNLETMFRGLMADVRQIKTQANESVNVLGQYQQKITELENLIQTQNQQMQNFEAALQSMMEVWEAKETAKEIASRPLEGQTYKVQSGDSLEKIARLHKVSVQALREVNQLTNDRIIIGQTLKIP